jgi:hypothetical protein
MRSKTQQQLRVLLAIFLRKNEKLVATLDDVAYIFKILTALQKKNSDAARCAASAVAVALYVANKGR